MSNDIVRHGVAARYSEAAVFNGVVYLAGMVPERGDTDIRGQTQDVLEQVPTLAMRGGDARFAAILAMPR